MFAQDDSIQPVSFIPRREVGKYWRPRMDSREESIIPSAYEILLVRAS